MTNTQTELNELHEAMCEAGIWPQSIEHTPDDYFDKTGYRWCYFNPINVVHCTMEDSEFLFIARGVAEKWLKKSEDELVYCPREEAYISLQHGYDVFAETLPAAIRYAHKMEKGGESHGL